METNPEEDMDTENHLEELADPVALLTEELRDIFIVDPAVELKKEEVLQDIKQRTFKDQLLTLTREKFVKEKKKHNNVTFKSERFKLELTKAGLEAQIKATEKAIDAEKCQLFLLHKHLEVQQTYRDTNLNENKKRTENALIGIQQAKDTELALDEQNEALIEERKSIEREIEHIDGDLSLYTLCKEILCKMSSVEWQEAQTAKQTSGVEDDHSPAPFISTPVDLLGIITKITEQNVSLIQNAHKVDDTLKELNQAILHILAKTKQADEKEKVQILDLTKRVDALKTSTGKLKQTVNMYDSIKTDDEDIMLNALAEQVSKKYAQFTDRRAQDGLTTLEMVANIESRMGTILNQLESIPHDFVEGGLKIKESEKRSRHREEQLQLEREKERRKKNKKYEHRTFKDPPKKVKKC